jgi:hypothetical protein
MTIAPSVGMTALPASPHVPLTRPAVGALIALVATAITPAAA